MRHLLRRLPSFRACSYGVRKKEGAERKSHFRKLLKDLKCKFSKNSTETALKEHFTVFFAWKMHSAQQEKTHNHVWRTLLQCRSSVISRKNVKNIIDPFFPHYLGPIRPKNHLTLGNPLTDTNFSQMHSSDSIWHGVSYMKLYTAKISENCEVIFKY